MTERAQRLYDCITEVGDGYLQETEAYRPKAASFGWKQWAALAAALALVIGIGKPWTWLRAGSTNTSNSPANRPSTPSDGVPSSPSGLTGMPATSSNGTNFSTPADAEPSGEMGKPESPGEPGSPTETTPSDPEPVLGWNIIVDNNCYTVLEIVEELAEGCGSLGELNKLYPDAPSPCTDAQAYVGCEVWAAEDGETLYVELPEGLYAMAVLAQP